jgi:hypothetical protein
LSDQLRTLDPDLHHDLPPFLGDIKPRSGVSLPSNFCMRAVVFFLFSLFYELLQSIKNDVRYDDIYDVKMNLFRPYIRGKLRFLHDKHYGV